VEKDAVLNVIALWYLPVCIGRTSRQTTIHSSGTYVRCWWSSCSDDVRRLFTADWSSSSSQ